MARFCEQLPPLGFCPEAKTRGGTLGIPACIHTRNFKKVRSVLLVWEECVGSMGSFLDLMELGAHGGLG